MEPKSQTYKRLCTKAAEHGFDSLTEMELEFVLEYSLLAQMMEG